MREAGHRPHDERLDEAGRLDRGDELLEEFGSGLAARRLESRSNRFNRDRAEALAIEAAGMRVQERLQLVGLARASTHGASLPQKRVHRTLGPRCPAARGRVILPCTK